MKTSKIQLALGSVIAYAAIALCLAVCAQAQQEKNLINFKLSGFAGAVPSDGVISDADGNLYGVTSAGGIVLGFGSGFGTVYETSPTASGGWTTKALYKFRPGTDGALPIGGLLMDSSGNLFGTTELGGTENCTDGFYTRGCGTIFELSPNGAGGWSEKVIFNFSQKEGWTPQTRLILDAEGNLYGNTYKGAERTGQCSNYSTAEVNGRIGPYTISESLSETAVSLMVRWFLIRQGTFMVRL